MKPAKVHYIHSLSLSARDRLAGTFVLVALLMMLALFVSKINFSKLFDPVVTYQAVMKNAQGITKETVINISGIDAGRVSDIYLDENKNVRINFFVYERFQPLVRADSIGEISKLSVVGDNIIIIKEGSLSEPMLVENASLQMKEPDYIDLTNITPMFKKVTVLITNLSQILDAIDPQVIRTGSQDLHKILADIRQISGQINDGKGSVGRVIYGKNEEKQVVNSLALIEKTLTGLSQRLDETQPIIANANELAIETKKIVEGAVKVSMESQKLMIDVRRSVSKVDQLLTQLPPLVNSTGSLVESADHTLNGLQPIHILIDNKIWPISSGHQPEKNRILIDNVGLDE